MKASITRGQIKIKPVIGDGKDPHVLYAQQFFTSFRRENDKWGDENLRKYCHGICWMHNYEFENVKDFAFLVSNGYAAFPCVKHDYEGYYNTKIENITGRYFIFVDVESKDETKIPKLCSDILAYMPIQPSFAFESDSSGKKGKGERCHLVWCFSDPITKDSYEFIWRICRNSAKIGFNIYKENSFEDDRSVGYGKMMYGNSNCTTALTTTNFKEYTLDEFLEYNLPPFDDDIVKTCNTGKTTNKTTQKTIFDGNDKEILYEVIKNIEKDRIDITGGFNDTDGIRNWFRIGCIIKSIVEDNDEGEKLFIRISQFHKDFNERATKDEWKRILSKYSSTTVNKATIGSILFLYNEHKKINNN